MLITFQLFRFTLFLKKIIKYDLLRKLGYLSSSITVNTFCDKKINNVSQCSFLSWIEAQTNSTLKCKTRCSRTISSYKVDICQMTYSSRRWMSPCLYLSKYFTTPRVLSGTSLVGFSRFTHLCRIRSTHPFNSPRGCGATATKSPHSVKPSRVRVARVQCTRVTPRWYSVAVQSWRCV